MGCTNGGHRRAPGACPRREDWGYRELLCEDIPASLATLRQNHPGLPVLFGGHSIGAQFAVLAAALHGGSDGLVAIGSGVPHWRMFPPPLRWLVGGFSHVLSPLTRALGHYPGDRLRFAGREAGQLMRDWAQTVRRGDYDRLPGLPARMGEHIARVEVPFLGLRLSEDWLVPEVSLRALMAATGSRARQERVFDGRALGTTPDHYAWMRQPPAVAQEIAGWWAGMAARVSS